MMLRCGVSKRCPMKREPAVMEQGMGLRTEAYWMPFTHNRYLKKHPRSRILARAEGAYYTSAEGKRLFDRSEEHTSELQSLTNLVCRLLLEKKNNARMSMVVTEKFCERTNIRTI